MKMTNTEIAQRIFDDMLKHQPTNTVPSLRKLGAKSCGVYAIRMVTETFKGLPYFKTELGEEVEKWEDIKEKLIRI
jgi:hypothetical protein